MLIRQWLQLIKLLNNGNMKVGFIFGLLLFLLVVPLSAQQVKSVIPYRMVGGEDDRGYERERSGSFLNI